MANPTTNFGWVMPTSTDLVTDLPADFNVFGQGVDTTMQYLKGGTTGQVLSKTSATDMAFTWVTTDDVNAIQNDIVDAKGDLIAASAADTPARLAVGTAGQILSVDSSTTTGLKWVTPNPGDITAVNVSSPITGGGTSGDVTISIQDASTAQKGSVQLSDSTSTTSSVLAATPTAVKSAYDLATAAIAKSTVTTAGDIIYRNATVPARLGIGTNGQVLAVSGGVPAWTTTADVTPLTTKGDLFTFDTADARLAVGTNAQVLTADSTASTGLKWATAAGSSSALVKVQASTFTAVANTSTTFDGVFTSTYKKYLVVFNGCASSAGAAVGIQTRVSGVTSATGYYGITQSIDYASSLSYVSSNNATSLGLGTWASTAATQFNLLFTNVAGSSLRPILSGTGAILSSVVSLAGLGQAEITTGFIITPASGTITGTITVYGLEN